MIYLVVMNLPRHVRYNPHNIIVVGVIPGPSEPSLSLNSYLTPLCKELSKFWSGVSLPLYDNVGNFRQNVIVRLALACVSCDLPASRKVCGFLSFNATLGCHKCFKKFTIDVAGTSDFSGYDRDNWPYRTNELHRDICKKLLQCVNKTELQNMEAKNGTRYSVLLTLPYFDPIKYTVIDPMHNLFLGTSKHVMHIWLEEDIISKNDLATMEKRLKSFRVPHEVGRLPNHLSAFNGFTANQCRSWITLFSPVLLKGIIPDDHLRCWLLLLRLVSYFANIYYYLLTLSQLICT